MAKVKVKCVVVGYHFDWMAADRDPVWTVVSSHDGKPSENCIHFQTQEFEVEVPDRINLVQAKVNGLEAAKVEALRDYQAKVAEINERLSKLQAIEHVAEAA